MGRARILVVDDDKIVVKAFARELESAGYEVFSAMAGEEAVKIAKNEKLDLVYVDLVMPEMNGVDVCRKIKEISPQIEVVLISGYPDEVAKYQMDFIEAGGREEWLRKPLWPDELGETAENILKEIRKGEQA